MLLRSSCAVCDRAGSVICGGCASSLRPAPSLALPLGIDRCHALLDYHACRELITSLKNGGRRDLIGWLASEMVGLVEPLPPGATVTWAPTSSARRRERGFDQAELLARAVARRCDLRCRPLLRRAPGPAQAGRGAIDRRVGPLFAPLARCSPAVLIVDDVITTGSTITAAARALRSGGATMVVAAVTARSRGRSRGRAA